MEVVRGMRDPMTWSLLGLLAICFGETQAYVQSSVQNESCDSRHSSDLEELMAQLKSSRKLWQWQPILLGMLLAFAIVGLAAYLGYAWIERQVARAQKSHATEYMEKMDGEALKKICGNANLPAWIRYPDFERVQWVNDLIDQLWPNIKAAAAGIVREQIGPQLRENKPAWISDISVESFQLGEKAPRISAIKVFNTDSVFDEVVIEMECVWNGAQKMGLAIKPFHRLSFGFGVDKAISKLLGMKVGVADLFFKGNVRIALKPLLDRIPLVGAAKVSLVEPPEFAYALKVQGGDISFLPGLEAWLNSIIKNVVLGPYILPEGITVPIDPESTNAQLPKGILYVKILEGRNLPWLDWFTFPTTYVRVGVRGRQRQRTTACKRTFSPEWNEEFMLLVHEPDAQNLSMILYDQQAFVANDKIIGHLNIPVKEMNQGETVDKWMPLQRTGSFEFGNPVNMGVQGVTTARDLARDVAHLPFNLRLRSKPELRVRMVYHEIEEADVQAAKGSQTDRQLEDGEQDADLVRMLRGGILLVKVRKQMEENSTHASNNSEIVNVRVGGQEKGTAATYGDDDPSWDEMIEFALPGDVLENEDEQVEVKVWDTHWVNKTHETMTWGMNAERKEGILRIPLRRIVEERKIEDTFRLENVGGSVDLELSWMPTL